MWIFKECTKCNEEKLLSEFKINKNCMFGVENNCRPCKTQYYKDYKKKNLHAFKIRWELDAIARSERLEKDIDFYNKSKEYQREYKRNRISNDIDFRNKCNVRNLIKSAIKRRGYKKNSKTFDILGCDYNTFIEHIENKFTDGMNWFNHGEWHIDHIYPVSRAIDENHLIELNHYTNLQPLWAKDNFSKGNRILP